MKKRLILVLTLIVILINVYPSFATVSNFTTVDDSQEVKLIDGEVKFLGAKSLNKIADNNTEYKNSEIVIDKLSLSGTKLNLVGKIDNKEFNLFGTIYQSRIHDEKLVIDSKDISGNFDIIHNGIFLEVPNNYKLQLGNNDVSENVFLLYLESNEAYYTYEFELPKKFIEEVSQLVFDDYGDEQVLIEHWWVKVYEPIVESMSSDTVQLNVYDNSVYTTRRLYYEDFDYTYEIDIILELYTDDLFRNKTTGYALIFIEDQRVLYNGKIVDDVEMLGVTNSVISIKLDARNDDVFRRVEWDTYSRYPNPRFRIEWGYGYGPFNIVLSGSSSNSSGSFIVPSSSSEQYKFISINNRTPILRVKDSHQTFYSIDELAPYSRRHYITADIDFDIFLINYHTIVDSDSYTLRGGYE